MIISDLSIRRPVLATVTSLMLIVLGLFAFSQLPLRELPDIDPPVVSVSTTYTGASAGVIETRITQVLEDAVSGIEGVTLLTSGSRTGRSSINIEFSNARDIESAANDVRDAISRAADKLPDDADTPQVAKADADSEVILWANLTSTGSGYDTLALTDYADRYLVDKLASIDGVAQVQLGGAQVYAMRVWPDSAALAARGLTVADVQAALRRENVELPAGSIESVDRDFTVRVERGYSSAAEFAKLALSRGADGHVVRLGEVARVALESAERRSYFRGNGKTMLGLGIVKTSTANSLDVARQAKAEIAKINATLPKGMQMGITYDSTQYIDVAVREVYKTLAEAIALVLVVIWLFLGSARAALIPAVTVPVCIIAAFMALYAFGFSINLLTLLALVLSIGLVVDDAIVVLENAQRRLDLGEPPPLAALRGSRQVAFAVIATTAVLISVFVPMAFQTGNNGRLFRELAVALAGAVAISMFVALTLTPMMCSLLLKPHERVPHGFSGWVDRRLKALSHAYRRQLEKRVGHPLFFMVILLAAMAASAALFVYVPRELAPTEDRGAFFISSNGPEGGGYDYTVKQLGKIEQVLLKHEGEGQPIAMINSRAPGGGPGGGGDMQNGQAIVILKPWSQRAVTTDEVVEQVGKELAKIPGVRALPQVRQGLVRGGGQPLQVVLGGPEYAQLVGWRDRLLARFEANPKLSGVDSDYKETRPQFRIVVDRDRAADLGVSAADIGNALQTMLGSVRATTFVGQGKEYDVLVQADRAQRSSIEALRNFYLRGRDGLVPLASLVTVKEIAEPGTLNRFNRLRSITVSARLAPGYPLGEAIDFAKAAAREELPDTAQVDFGGQSREYLQAGGAALFTFGMALLVVFLVLAAQFESFVHPLVIMLTVPLAVFGALLGLAATGNTINLFSQIGIVMLVGLAAKNGILIVEFANQRRDEGLEVRAAILDAAATRLRPILMTSVATVTGALPLMFAHGAGSASRAAIGVVVVFGVLLSTLLSLFVVPAFYLLLARYTRPPEARTRMLEQLEGEIASVDRAHGG
ncbi:MAG: efflux RND transporter permease subunit [Arenimonas sp.]